MMSRFALIGLLSASVAVAQAPLPKDHAERMARGTDVFKKHVRPLLVQHCLKCHGGEKTESELDITDRDRLLKGGEHGPAFVSGEPSKSLLYLMSTHQKKPVMPYKEPKLSDESLRHLATWIENGAPYDAPLVNKADASAWIDRKVAPEARQHWAYQPLRPVTAPAIANAPWARNDIDRFILKGLQDRKITPTAPADRRTLLRRVTFDLTGLPPTPDELAAFEKDQSPDAFARVVDRLLDSPRYGERWARHWLDLVRFAESHGFEHDYDRPTAYHYRDFVIRAFNEGLPFNTFVRWQLAGDEIEPNNPLALFATGYLAAGVHSTQITKNEVEKHRYDELDDMLSTTGTAMLGLTIGCARCHDHKYDAIPAGDYYRLLSTFTATVRTEASVEVDRQAYLAARAKFDAEHAPLVKARADYETNELAARFAEWEKSATRTPLKPGWMLPEIVAIKSAGGATLTRRDDGSVLVGGTNPPRETLTFTLKTGLSQVSAIRLEALPDASLVKKGPGRAGNGNFCLTDFKVQHTGVDGKAVPVKLKSPRSTFDQKSLPVTAAIDDDPNSSGWAVDPQFGHLHAASFEFESAVGPGTLTVTMRFHNNVGHGMGRPRLSVATTPMPLDASASAEAILTAQSTPPEKRTPEQKATLLQQYKSLDAGWQKLNAAVEKHLANAPKPNVVKALISSEGAPAVRLHSQGEDVLKDTHFLRRGDPNQKEAIAKPGYLQVLFAGADKWSKPAPTGSKLSHRRSAFADWITDPNDGAGHLLARVIVNRLWQKHMGRGIVATPSDFGVRGEKPTHPELLDFLANELIRNGWKLKPIHKLIISSATYQTSVTNDPMVIAQDRDNTMFGRRSPRRLDAESLRDSLLAISGTLDERMYGAGTLDEASKRRSIYFTMKRSRLISMLTIFDAPDGTVGIGERTSTTIAPQALLLMNNPQVRQWAKAFAGRAKAATPEASVEQAYRLALQRSPTESERREGVDFLATQTKSYATKPDAAQLSLADFCQVIFCLNELAYVQ